MYVVKIWVILNARVYDDHVGRIDERIRHEITRLQEERTKMERLRNDLTERSKYLQNFTSRTNYNRKNHLDGTHICTVLLVSNHNSSFYWYYCTASYMTGHVL